MSEEPTFLPQRHQADVPALTDADREFIEFFIQFCDVLDLPKSIGSIYGLLFTAPVPMSQAQIQEALEISKGSASQGIRFLRDLGAVQVSYAPGTSQEFFSAETALRHLVKGLYANRIAPRMEKGTARLESIKARIATIPDPARRAHIESRLKTADAWLSKGRALLPILMKFL